MFVELPLLRSSSFLFCFAGFFRCCCCNVCVKYVGRVVKALEWLIRNKSKTIASTTDILLFSTFDCIWTGGCSVQMALFINFRRFCHCCFALSVVWSRLCVFVCVTDHGCRYFLDKLVGESECGTDVTSCRCMFQQNHCLSLCVCRFICHKF